MGLDNYIYIRRKDTQKRLSVDDILDRDYAVNYFKMLGGFVCYWRKFWGFRDEVVEEVLKNRDSEVLLTLEDLVDILVTLEKYTEAGYYEGKDANWIWSWREYLSHLVKTIANLRLLIDDIVEGRIDLDEYEVLWVDSY